MMEASNITDIAAFRTYGPQRHKSMLLLLNVRKIRFPCECSTGAVAKNSSDGNRVKQKKQWRQSKSFKRVFLVHRRMITHISSKDLMAEKHSESHPMFTMDSSVGLRKVLLLKALNPSRVVTLQRPKGSHNNG